MRDPQPGDRDRREPSRPGDRPARPGTGGLMPEVHLTVNGRSYPVSCEEGEEKRIKELAQYVDRKTQEFVAKLGQIGEARLLVLAALVITDELADAHAAIRRQSPGAGANGVDT